MVRAKITVASITKFPPNDHPEAPKNATVRFAAVYRDDPGHENKTFWTYTPSMTFEMQLSPKAATALDFFEQAMHERRELYLDFSIAPTPGD